MKIVIVGCGWLGQQLAAVLSSTGYQVYASRRSAAALADLPPGVTGITLDLNQAVVTDAALNSIFHAAVVICAIAPGRQQPGNNYVQSLQRLNAVMQQAGSRALLHFSSSGIYQGLDGDADETAELQLQHPRVQLLAGGEQALQQFGCCITLRLAGLMGPGRHPGRFVAGKTLPDPDAPVNMLHSNDIVAAVQSILAQPAFSPAIYNLCCPEPVSRRIFYQQAAVLAGSEVEFALHTDTQRRVNPQRFIAQYGFHYRYQSACDALTD
ncbi:NAD(P)H-binding protein [Rheinheimera sp.]|uniref:NAD(P)H-binding protein n=1 Tax=Rheinheimera sp. TaxID=1869214 RepID=UPI002734420E|nr:NAD(P)H-binding protein [Rheinheimera sp.]MDP2714923.1 NAD(P)H-binding protein [Rheinheimera sp.]